MNYQLGFPVIHSKTGVCHHVWLHTRDRQNNEDRQAYWNDTLLASVDPFGTTAPLTTVLISGVLQHSVVYFISSLEPEEENGVSTARLGGDSGSLLISLCGDYSVDKAGDGSCHLLLSSRFAYGRIESLDESDETEKKSAFARKNKFGLLLHPADYDKLETGFVGRSHAASARLPESAEKTSYQIEQVAEGRAFCLPPGVLTARQPSQQLAQLLGLRRRGTSVVTANLQPPGDIERVAVSAAGQSLRDLFVRALPSRPAYVESLATINAGIFGITPHPGGVVSRSLQAENVRALFYSDDHASEFEHRHVFVGGPTASGKSFLAECLALNAAIEQSRPVLYIAPTRELVYQLYRKFQSKYCVEGTLEKRDIICSTGERNRSDRELRTGRFKIAFVVNEKANILLNPDLELLEKVGLVVVDEAHVIGQFERGGVLDTMLAKLLLQNKKRASPGPTQFNADPVRVVLISTEDVVSNEPLKNLFSDRQGKKPVQIATSDRIHPVQHKLVTFQGNVITYPIVKFANDSDRMLGLGMVREIARQAQALKVVRRDEHREALIDFLNDLRCRHRRILVAARSPQFAMGLARQLIFKSAAFKNETAAREFKQVADKGLIETNAADELHKFAECGMYFHYGDLHATLREWSACHFARGLEDGIRGEILFSTETLTYGVNLAVDCVVLLDQKFTRRDPVSFTERPIPLTPTEFHNILGRVGRPDFFQEGFSYSAYICAARNEADERSIKELLTKYYAEPSTFQRSIQRLSALFTEADLELVTDHDLVSEETEKITLDEVSFPAFRSTMDVLRHQGLQTNSGGASLKEMESLLAKTVFWQTASVDHQARIKKILRKILDASNAENNMALVNKTGKDQYQIGVQAAALIDTGTNWRSVKPIQQWLDMLYEMKKQSLAVEIPIEFLVAGFVVSVDLWNGAKGFAFEVRQQKNSRIHQDEIEGIVGDLMLKEAQQIASDEYASRFRLAVAKLADAQALSDVGDAVTKRTAIFRIVTALMRWLRGASIDEVNLLSHEDPTKRKAGASQTTFNSKIFDRAQRLAKMSLQFFEQTPGLLLPEHVRELLRLSLRLHHGVSRSALPFVQNATEKSELNRVTAHELLKNSLTPSSIIISRNPVAAIVDGTGYSLERSAAIADVVFKYYYEEVDNLADALLKGSFEYELVSKAVNDFRNTISALLAPPANNSGVNVHAHQCGNFNADLERLLSVAPRAPAVVLKHEAGNARRDNSPREEPIFEVRPLRAGTSTESQGLAIVSFPWRPNLEPTKRVQMSASGALVTAVLAARGFIDECQIRAWLMAQAPRFISVGELVGSLPFARPVPPDLREAILGFNEPNA